MAAVKPAAAAADKPAVHWCFTLNNPTPEEKPEVCLAPYTYLVYQLEEGENKTPHYQGFVAFAKPCRLSALKKRFGRAHWGSANGTAAQNKAYCTKTEGRLSEPFEDGTMPPGQGARTDLKRVADQISGGARLSEVAISEPSSFMKYANGIAKFHAVVNKAKPRDVKAFYLYGPTGIGKSHAVYAQFGVDNVHPLAHGKQHWFDRYDGQKVLLLDEFTPDEWTTQELLRLLDRWPYNCPVKGGFVSACWDTVILLSNYPPPPWPEEMLRRFNCKSEPGGFLDGPHRIVLPPAYAPYDQTQPVRILHARARDEIKPF